MKPLNLPVFEFPELPPKPIPPEAAESLMLDTVRRLKESGEYRRLRELALYQPADVRFELAR